MDEKRWARAAVVFAGGALGTGLRVALLDLLGHEVLGLALINLTGAFLLGVVSGAYANRITMVRLFLAVGGLASFTSWSTLTLQSMGPDGVLVAALETAAGVGLAGLGHLAARTLNLRRRGRR